MVFPNRPDEWWAIDENTLAEVESDDDGMSLFVGRYIDGEWEYALVEWSRGFATLRYIAKGGKVIKYAR